MSDTRLDQAEEILSYEISDEALESAAGIKRAANYTSLLHRFRSLPRSLTTAF